MMEKKDKYAAQTKYQQRVGFVSYSYRLKRSLVDEFREKCKSEGASQAGAISAFMRAYIANPEVMKVIETHGGGKALTHTGTEGDIDA